MYIAPSCVITGTMLRSTRSFDLWERGNCTFVPFLIQLKYIMCERYAWPQGPGRLFHPVLHFSDITCTDYSQSCISRPLFLRRIWGGSLECFGIQNIFRCILSSYRGTYNPFFVFCRRNDNFNLCVWIVSLRWCIAYIVVAMPFGGLYK